MVMATKKDNRKIAEKDRTLKKHNLNADQQNQQQQCN